jgi:hypothetical protein
VRTNQQANPHGLRLIHQPRPWHCSGAGPEVKFCTHHGDCHCGLGRSSSCPIHGDHTDHPYPQPHLKEAPR